MTDGTRPHQFPNTHPAGDLIGWCCQACGEWIDELADVRTDCPVDWRKPSTTDDIAASIERLYALIGRQNDAHIRRWSEHAVLLEHLRQRIKDLEGRHDLRRPQDRLRHPDDS